MQVTAIAVVGLLVAGCGAADANTPTVVTIPSGAPAPPSEPGLAAPGAAVVEAMGPIHVGQPISEVRAAFGPETRVATYAEETSEFDAAGYGARANILVLLGFDQVLVWETPPQGVGIPFWKVYVRDGRVVGFVVTSYGSENDPTTAKTSVANTCFLLGDEATIKQTFGADPVVVHDGAHGHATYNYLSRGVAVLAKEGKVRVFQVFGRLSAEKQAKARALLTD
jgi:hypothetical protein